MDWACPNPALASAAEVKCVTVRLCVRLGQVSLREGWSLLGIHAFMKDTATLWG